MSSLSEVERERVLVELKNGVSTRKVAALVGTSQSSVVRLKKKSGIEVEKQKGGRPRCLSAREKKRCVSLLTEGRLKTATKTAAQLQEVTGKFVSAITVRRALREEGLAARVQWKKPLLKRKHVLARLRFAQKYENWTIEDWKHVIFSDETKVNRFNSDGRSWCWIREGEGIQPQQVCPTVKHGGGSIMMWGCMTAFGPGYAYRIQGRMDRHLYKFILENFLWSTIQHYCLDPSKLVFQQDNDPKHTSKLVQAWLASQEFQLLQWPAQSPDLNPMEHFWGVLKQRLNQFSTPPQGIEELWERVSSVCSNFSVEDCMTLYNSMPRRIAAVLAAKGYWTKY